MAAFAIDYQPMTTIRLYGQLRQFGRSFRLSVRSPAEAIKALCIQTPGFERFISNAKSQGIEFAVFRGSKTVQENELSFSGSDEIRIAPVVTGSKRGRILSNHCWLRPNRCRICAVLHTVRCSFTIPLSGWRCNGD